MNTDTLKGSWKQFVGKIRETWGNLTDDELAQVEGKREQLVGLIQKKYGHTKEEIESQLSKYDDDCGCS